MPQWYVKDLSKLTGVSVQTLHHYDKIGLLKPSTRSASRYRLYSETDLLKLQQIIALKFFGFSLIQIKKLLSENVNVADQFSSQVSLLEEKAETLLNASHTLKRIISKCQFDKSIPWTTILQMIEVFHNTKKLEKTLSSKVFTADEMKQYASFKADFDNRFTEADRKAFEKKYSTIVEFVKSHIHEDPTHAAGIKIAKQYMKMIDKWYGEEHANLKHAVWKKGYKKGILSGLHNLTPEIVTWLNTACGAYYNAWIRDILTRSETDPNKAKKRLNGLIREYAGNSKELRQELFKTMLNSSAASASSKKWLKQFISHSH